MISSPSDRLHIGIACSTTPLCPAFAYNADSLDDFADNASDNWTNNAVNNQNTIGAARRVFDTWNTKVLPTRGTWFPSLARPRYARPRLAGNDNHI
jgi:hypothetical protein